MSILTTRTVKTVLPEGHQGQPKHSRPRAVTIKPKCLRGGTYTDRSSKLFRSSHGDRVGQMIARHSTKGEIASGSRRAGLKHEAFETSSSTRLSLTSSGTYR